MDFYAVYTLMSSYNLTFYEIFMKQTNAKGREIKINDEIFVRVMKLKDLIAG